VGWLATLSSFRGAPADALVRAGASQAVVRGLGRRDGRELLLEGSIPLVGRARVQVNRQPLRRARDLLGALRVTIFSPDDLALVKEGPAVRRAYLDELLVSCHPKWEVVRADVERVLRQRATLLKQAGGRLTTDVASTLDVWDAQLATHGEALADARAALLADLGPEVSSAYASLAGAAVAVSLSYVAQWRPVGLADALAAARAEDVRRGVSTVGPHRDDLVLSLDGLPARTHGSQGEQRTLALALRLGGHVVVRGVVGEAPVLLLDDVFSELDEQRAAALVAHLPAGQAVLTTAGAIPPGVTPALRLRVERGTVSVG
jgi:DNA replication and repair protein RecF